MLDDAKLDGEVRAITSASIVNWYDTTLNYILVLTRAEPLDGQAAKT